MISATISAVLPTTFAHIAINSGLFTACITASESVQSSLEISLFRSVMVEDTMPLSCDIILAC